MKRYLTRSLSALCAALLLAIAQPAPADIIDDLASATIIEDFLFNDVAGTAIEAAVNSANPGNLFDADADNAGVLTNGSGQLDASGKNNTSFGSNYVDEGDFNTGRYLGVMELTWDFNTAVFDAGELEEVRLTFTNNDPRGTQVTSQVMIQRTSLSTLEITGQATGGDALGPDALSPAQATKFIAVLDADLDNDMYQVHYSADGGTSFTSLGPGGITADRILNAMRFVLNNDFSDDTMLIDRIYLARAIPEPSGMMLAMLSMLGLAAARRQR